MDTLTAGSMEVHSCELVTGKVDWRCEKELIKAELVYLSDVKSQKFEQAVDAW